MGPPGTEDVIPELFGEQGGFLKAKKPLAKQQNSGSDSIPD